jgi:outer membrane protein
VTILLNLAAAVAAAQAQTQPLTLDEAVNIALRNAFSIQTAASRVEQARQRVNENRGQLGPRVNLGATYTRFEQETRQQSGPPPAPSIVVQPIDTTVATAGVTVPIDISGQIRNIVRASQASLRASQETLEATRNDVRLAVKADYFNVLRADAQVKVQEQALADAQERLRSEQLQFEEGAKARIDVIRLQTQVAQAQSDLIGARTNLALTKEQLNNTLARPIDTPVELVDVTALPAAPPDPDRLDAAAQASRPEVRALQQTRESLANVRRSQEAGNRPSLSVGVNYQANIGNKGATSRDHSTVGTVALNWPVFDSGVTRARVAQARQDEEQARIQLEQVRLGVSLEVRQALTNLINSAARLDVATKQVELAQENYRLAKVRDEAGAGTILEIVDAQTALTQARTQLVAARYDYLTAYSALQRAVGTDDVASAALRGPTGGTK